MTIRDYVRSGAAPVERHTTLAEAARLMDERAVGAVVVVDDGHPVGIVTERDLVTRALAHRYPSDAWIESVMSGHVVTVTEGTDAPTAIAAFRDHDVRHLPIVDASGTVVDVLSADDLLVGLAAELVEAADAMGGVPASDEGDLPPTPQPA